MSDALAHKAAALWGFDPAQVTLAARRENAVYRVADRFALRLHRPGYRSADQLTSELHWMAALERGGMAVPRPVPSQAGRLIETLGDCHVDVLTWVPGRMLGAQGALEGVADRTGFACKLGRLLAQLHDLSDAWTPPNGFTRPAWDRAGLVGDAPVWGRFWDHPHLTPDQRALFIAVRDRANADLAAREGAMDYGLIHADAITENIMLVGDVIALIDFDDGGWGFRDFELATFLMRQIDAPDYAALRAALLDGYSIRRRVDAGALDLMLVLRALTYPGWIMDRLAEQGAPERSARAIATALRLAKPYLENGGP